ncbi:MAG: serine/threonine protein kinase [Anaerolineae bacterium]|nr:serine/threonine protein kinase [Anaerolineae bacterium]
MRSISDRLGQLLLILAMGLALFVLGCGYKQITTEVWEDGSGRNVILMAIEKEQDDPQAAADQQQQLEDARRDAEECGASTLPYEDSRYRGYQAIFDFRSFSEIPGQISCLIGSTANLQIEGRYEESGAKKSYWVNTRIKPFSLWGLCNEDPMLYRVIMPGQIVVYNDQQSFWVRTVKDGGNQVSWYFTCEGKEGESDIEFSLSAQADKLAPTAVPPPTLPPPTPLPPAPTTAPTATPRRASPTAVIITVPVTVPPPTSQPPTEPPGWPTATATPAPSPVPSDLVMVGGIFLLTTILIVAIGILVWKLVGAKPGSQAKHSPPSRSVTRAATAHQDRPPSGERTRTRAPTPTSQHSGQPAHTYPPRPGSPYPQEPTRPSPPAPPSQYPSLGTVLDRYQIRAELGQGGMGAVYRARHQTLERDVALKILAPWLTQTPDFIHRFQQEGRILAQLSHPHIVTVHDAGSALGYYYLVMELVEGSSLDRALHYYGRLEPRQAITIAHQTAQALAYAHQKGIIHRDIKPANILLDKKGQTKVADFGIVAIVGENQAATTRIGTPRYMSHEQFAGAATPQSDLYSLGACLYEMLTGQCPPAFGVQPPTPPSHLNQAVQPALDLTVLTALRPDPRQRYATVAEFMTDLEQAW